MLYTTPRASHALRTLQALSALAAALALSGCGGGDDAAALASTPAPPIAGPPPPAVSTTVTGAVVKGPVSGAQVCAYTVVANARGAALGSCTTTDASGNYSFAVPAGSGPLWVEATGGTYTDEITRAVVTLPAGSPLVSLTTATGSTATTMLTPLTTLALNAARTTAGAAGTLDASAFTTATTQLLAAFNLPATLNLATTLPVFGAGINSYGTALTAVSRMVANGLPLAQILAATQPSALAAAYATAANPPAVPPPTSGGTPSASGTLTAAGALAGSITPQADGYAVTVSATKVTHRFFLTPVAVAGVPSGTSTAEVTVTREFRADGSTITSVSYADPRVSLRGDSCDVRVSASCGVTLSTPAGATHPVSVTFNNTPLVGGGTLNGTLIGDAPGALWSPAELPRTSSGAVAINGVSTAVTSGSVLNTAGGGNTLLSISLNLADGSQVAVNRTNAEPFTVTRVVYPSTVQQCGVACNVALTESAAGVTVAFTGTALTGGVTLGQSAFIGKTQGSLSNNGNLGGFTPVSDSVTAVNDARTFTFSVLGTSAQAGISLFSVTVRNGRVTEASAVIGIGLSLYKCGDALTVIGYPACSGITVAASGSSFTFSNANLAGGAIGAARTTIAFNGTLTAKGL